MLVHDHTIRTTLNTSDDIPDRLRIHGDKLTRKGYEFRQIWISQSFPQHLSIHQSVRLFLEDLFNAMDKKDEEWSFPDIEMEITPGHSRSKTRYYTGRIGRSVYFDDNGYKIYTTYIQFKNLSEDNK